MPEADGNMISLAGILSQTKVLNKLQMVTKFMTVYPEVHVNVCIHPTVIETFCSKYCQPVVALEEKSPKSLGFLLWEQ